MVVPYLLTKAPISTAPLPTTPTPPLNQKSSASTYALADLVKQSSNLPEKMITLSNMNSKEIISSRFQVTDSLAQRVSTQNNARTGTYIESGSFQNWASAAMSLLQDVFGVNSAHYTNFVRTYTNWHSYPSEFHALRGIYNAAKSDFENGFLKRLETTISGELLGDFVRLAKEALREGHKDVAAVLASAALEDALKRYATSQGLTVSDQVMQSVVAALKSAGLVSGAQKSLLDAMPKIRDYAMHANWDKLTKEDVSSILGFVEQFLMEKF